MKRFFNTQILEILIIVFLGFTPLIWYKPGTIALGHDMGFPLAPVDHFLDRLFVWTERVGSFGSNQAESLSGFFIHGLEAVVSSLGFSLVHTQQIVFVFWFLAPGLSMYVLLKSLRPEKNYWVFRLTGSLFYMMNHFFLQAWFIAERTKFSAATALPLMLMFTINALYKERSILINGILIGLTLFFFNAGPGIPLYAGLVVVIGFAALFFTLKGLNKPNFFSKIFRTFRFGLLAVIAAVILNFYWIAPMAVYSISNYTTRVSQAGGVEGVILWSREISKNTSYMNLIRLQGIPDWYDNQDHPYSQNFINNPVLITISFAWPLIAFSSLLFVRRKQDREYYYVAMFSILSLLGIFFTAGSHPPLGFIYDFLLKNVPGFSALRTPFYKFGIIVWFSYSVLIGWGIQYFILWLRERPAIKLYKPLSYLVLPILIIMFSYYNYPYFSGIFFNWSKNYSTMLKVPNSIYDFKSWIDGLRESTDRVLLIPNIDPNTKYEIYDWRYFSLSTLPSILTNKSVVANDASSNNTEDLLIRALYDNLLYNNDITIAKFLNIGHFLVREDFNAPLNGNYDREAIIKVITESGRYEKEKQFGQWHVYKAKEYERFPLIYASVDNTFVSSYMDDASKALAVPGYSYGDSFMISGSQPDYSLNTDVVTGSVVKGVCRSCLTNETTNVRRSPVRLFAQSRLVYFLEKEKNKKTENIITNPEHHIDYLLGNILKKEALVTKILSTSKDETFISEIYNDMLRSFEKITQLQKEIDVPERRKYYTQRIFAHVDYMNYRSDEILSTTPLINVVARTKDLKWSLANLDLQRPELVATQDDLYGFHLPTAGEYRIYVTQTPHLLDKQEAEIDLQFDGKTDRRSVARIAPEWLDLGSYSFKEGPNNIVIPIKKEAVLEGFPGVFDVDSPRNVNTCKDILFPATTETIYNISFLYRTEIGEPITIRLIQDVDSVDPKKRPIYAVDMMVEKDATWKKFEYEYKPHKFTKEANVQLCINSNNKEQSKVQISEFQVRSSSEPEIFLVSKKPTPQQTPTVSFTKINQTKYLVSTNNATDTPYILNFNQRFDDGWVVKELDLADNSFQKEQTITENRFGIEYAYDFQINYKLRDKKAEDYSHFVNNGFNNAWVIEAGNKNLLLEYEPQNVFMKSVPVTIVGFISTVAILFFARRKRIKNAN